MATAQKTAAAKADDLASDTAAKTEETAAKLAASAESVTAELNARAEDVVSQTVDATRRATEVAVQMRETAEKQVRELAERGVQQAKEGYSRLKSAAEETSDALEDAYATASRSYKELGRKSVEATRSNVNAHFDFLNELIVAKSISQAVELQGSYARRQLEAVRGQVAELSGLAQKATVDGSKPFQDLATKGLRFASAS